MMSLCMVCDRLGFSLAVDLTLVQAHSSAEGSSLNSLTLQQVVQDVNGKHLLKVEPLNAILDPQYFVRAVHQCTLSVLHGREADAFQNAAANAGFGYTSQFLLLSSLCMGWMASCAIAFLSVPLASYSIYAVSMNTVSSWPKGEAA